MKLDIKSNINQVRAELKLTGSETVAAGVRALNRTAGTARNETAKALRKEYPGIKAAAMKSRIKLQRATAKSPESALVFSGRRFVLWNNFGMRAQGPWGVGFRRLPWRIETPDGSAVSPEMLKRAFRQRGRGGRPNVWSRETKERDSMTLLLAPSVAKGFAERQIMKVLQNTIRTRFPVVMAQEAKFRVLKRES